MYNFMEISPKLEELLNFEVTATLREMRTNKNKKTTEGETKQYMTRSHIFNETRSSRELKRETCYCT